VMRLLCQVLAVLRVLRILRQPRLAVVQSMCARVVRRAHTGSVSCRNRIKRNIICEPQALECGWDVLLLRAARLT
jgi:hypothetical protein